MNKTCSPPSAIYDVQPAENPVLFSFMLKFYHFFKAELKSSLPMNTFSPLQSTMILFLSTLLIFSLILPYSSTDTIAVYIVFQTVRLAIYSHKWPWLVDTILFWILILMTIKNSHSESSHWPPSNQLLSKCSWLTLMFVFTTLLGPREHLYKWHLLFNFQYIEKPILLFIVLM